ncbi:amidohydrolase family protein [Chthonobacter rhizosphaerae]|uniref:amidohydrolase family protein n=1 Tax=Chthonobacter rhizosphaerae TaxID=2735553 RepID=UPI0015EF6C87|nr:amidohydrolase [Chthonobacter rhizosphaerae]
MRLIDTHLHLVDRRRLAYPWLASTPALDRDYAYATYAAEALAGGITDALHMEVDVAPEDMERETAVVAEIAERPGNLVRGAIAACRPEDPGFPAYLERQRVQPLVKGFRRVLHVVPDDVSEGALFRENIARLSGTGYNFDICVDARQIPKAIALVDSAPGDIPFVLDHCGVPAVKDRAEHPWAARMSEMAKRPNVAVKISGVVAYAGSDWTVEDLRPFVEHAIEAFGWDRVVWGSDWPVCTLTADLTRWIEATMALTAGCSEEQRAALFHLNAERIYRVA